MRLPSLLVLALPVGPRQRVLDLAVLRPREGGIPLLMERPHVRRSRLLHHPSEAVIDHHRLRPDTSHAQLSEALAHQGTRSLGRLSLAPPHFVQAVAQFDIVRVVSVHHPSHVPPQPGFLSRCRSMDVMVMSYGNAGTS